MARKHTDFRRKEEGKSYFAVAGAFYLPQIRSCGSGVMGLVRKI